MLFADDIVLIDETRKGVNDKLEQRRHTLDSKSFRVSRSKTQHLHCCFSGREDIGREVTIDRMAISKVKTFKYLGSIIQQKGDVDEHISQRIKVGRQKWKWAM